MFEGQPQAEIEALIKADPEFKQLYQRHRELEHGMGRVVLERGVQVRVAHRVHAVLDGQTLGTPIGILVRNTDQRPSAYTEMQTAYRPSHADYTYDAKFGIRAVSGGGRSSARETIGRVAGGAIARKVLQACLPSYQAVAYVKTIQGLTANVDPSTVTAAQVESNIVRTGDPADRTRRAAGLG